MFDLINKNVARILIVFASNPGKKYTHHSFTNLGIEQIKAPLKVLLEKRYILEIQKGRYIFNSGHKLAKGITFVAKLMADSYIRPGVFYDAKYAIFLDTPDKRINVITDTVASSYELTRRAFFGIKRLTLEKEEMYAKILNYDDVISNIFENGEIIKGRDEISWKKQSRFEYNTSTLQKFKKGITDRKYIANELSKRCDVSEEVELLENLEKKIDEAQLIVKRLRNMKTIDKIPNRISNTAKIIKLYEDSRNKGLTPRAARRARTKDSFRIDSDRI